MYGRQQSCRVFWIGAEYDQPENKKGENPFSPCLKIHYNPRFEILLIRE
jgi:hypothetical protein